MRVLIAGLLLTLAAVLTVAVDTRHRWAELERQAHPASTKGPYGRIGELQNGVFGSYSAYWTCEHGYRYVWVKSATR